jgi:hypothetical protein
MQHVRARGERERRSTGDGQRGAEQTEYRAQPERELVQVEAGGSTLDIGEREGQSG